ncbi:high-affinity Fe2+/Pb2+ permease [Methylobacterium sp. RAS18]|nr:high-affinity Fe2+/Pb2+ permease [Methylobacterium sp. RAS18]
MSCHDALGVFLLGLAFLIVYRKVFETILFYAAIWNQGGGRVPCWPARL